jgi:hypothetical protein
MIPGGTGLLWWDNLAFIDALHCFFFEPMPPDFTDIWNVPCLNSGKCSALAMVQELCALVCIARDSQTSAAPLQRQAIH